MSEPTPTFDRTAPNHPGASLSPSVREIVTDALPSPDRSLAVGLSQAARDVGLDHRGQRAATNGDVEGKVPGSESTSSLVEAVQCFEGYVGIRADLLGSDHFDHASERDAAVLASDYLHAAAYTQLEGVSDSSRQTVSMYQVLTRGSSALSTAFHVQSAGTRRVRTESPTPEAVLAGTASELGATAAGATEDAREALQRYGRSLLGAITEHPSPSDAVGEVATLVLSGRLEDGAVEGDATASPRQPAADDGRPALVSKHVQRAREAIATLERSPGHQEREVADTPTDPDSRSPLRRLERATRIPFGNVVDDDG